LAEYHSTARNFAGEVYHFSPPHKLPHRLIEGRRIGVRKMDHQANDVRRGT
jgi:hypothetical protein